MTATLINECIEWDGWKDKDGYGLSRENGTITRAHRAAYEKAFGPIPKGMQVDHTCQNTSCINTNHLEAVTHKENQRRKSLRITHCKRGHEFTGNNVRVRSNGMRECRECVNAGQRKRYHAH